MVRLHGLGEDIAWSASDGDWPASGPMNERLLEIAHKLSRAAELMERCGRDIQPSEPEKRADIAATRARIMHTLYVGVHGTVVALGEYAKDLRSRLRVDAQRRRQLELQPTARENRGRCGDAFPISKSSSRLRPDTWQLTQSLRAFMAKSAQLALEDHSGMHGQAHVSSGIKLPDNPAPADPLSDTEVLAIRREHWEYYKDMASIALKEAEAQLSLLNEL
jgi:hypothetical protein